MTMQEYPTQIVVNVVSEDAAAAHILDAFRSIFADVRSVIETVPEPLYARMDGIASVGKHVRHILEFLDVLLNQYSSGTVNYDIRDRQAYYETPEGAAAYMKTLEQKLTTLLLNPLTDVKKELLVQRRLIPDGAFIPLRSSLGDQLASVVEHATHHLSMINSIVKQFNIRLRDGLGISPATIAHQKLS